MAIAMAAGIVAKASAVMEMPKRVSPCGVCAAAAAQSSGAMSQCLRVAKGGVGVSFSGLSWCGVAREAGGEVGILAEAWSRQLKKRQLSRVVVKASTEPATAQAQGLQITINKTRGIEGQQTGETGLRKRVKVFKETSYLANWVQSFFFSLPPEDVKGSTLLLGGDGRHFNKEAAQIILKIAAGNGVGKMLVARNCLLSTPAASAVIRRRKLNGGFIMTSSHDMGGPNQLWGIKFNYRNGQPVPEFIRDKIYKHTLTITEIRTANLPDVNFSNLGTFNYGNFSVEVFEPVADYLDLLKGIFDFELLRSLLMRPDFRFKFDCMYGVTAAYARPIFVDALGAPESSIANGKPLEDFGGLRPDPNLVYSAQLAKTMNGSNAPDFGAASDGDGDRIMILGKQFYVCPSDSVAIIAANAQTAIPYFRNGLKGVARSVFTSGALDCVAQKLQLPFFEVPSGWKHFGNLMDAGKLSICGEECFEIGADHIREKDSIWAVLAWLSILAHKNHGRRAGEKLVSIPDVTKEHWDAYGRNYFTRHDYEDCETRVANAVLENTRIFMSKCKPGDKFGDFTLKYAEDFKYVDPVDKSVATKQGVRYIFTEGARIMFGLTPGAGSAGPTLRLYAEKYESDKSRLQLDTQPVLRPLMEIALRICQLKEYLRRDKPNVIS